MSANYSVNKFLTATAVSCPFKANKWSVLRQHFQTYLKSWPVLHVSPQIIQSNMCTPQLTCQSLRAVLRCRMNVAVVSNYRHDISNSSFILTDQ